MTMYRAAGRKLLAPPGPSPGRLGPARSRAHGALAPVTRS